MANAGSFLSRCGISDAHLRQMIVFQAQISGVPLDHALMELCASDVIESAERLVSQAASMEELADTIRTVAARVDDPNLTTLLRKHREATEQLMMQYGPDVQHPRDPRFTQQLNDSTLMLMEEAAQRANGILCAHPDCKMTECLRKCSGCFRVAYCTEEHQMAHWPEHRKVCAYHPPQ